VTANTCRLHARKTLSTGASLLRVQNLARKKLLRKERTSPFKVGACSRKKKSKNTRLSKYDLPRPRGYMTVKNHSEEGLGRIGEREFFPDLMKKKGKVAEGVDETSRHTSSCARFGQL